MADFVQRWNDEGRTPRIEFSTPTELAGLLGAADLPTRRGDWTDWWSDGVGSSAYETGVNRSTHELLLAAEAIGAWLTRRGPQRLGPRARRGRLRAGDAVRRAHLGRVREHRRTHLPVHQGAVEPQGVVRLRGVDGDPRRARPHGAGAGRLARRAGHRGQLQSRRAHQRGGVSARGGNRAARREHPAVGAHGPRRGARPARRRSAGRDARAVLPAATSPGAARCRTSRRDACSPSCPGSAMRSSRRRSRPRRTTSRRSGTESRTRTTASRSTRRRGRSRRGSTRSSTTTSRASIGAGGSAQYVYEGVEGDRDALFAMDFSRDDFGVWQVDPPFRYGTPTSVHVGEPVDPRGPRVDRRRDRGRRRSQRPCSLPARDRTPLARRRVAAREGARRRPRVRLRRLSLQPRRASIPARPQRRPMLAERGPARVAPSETGIRFAAGSTSATASAGLPSLRSMRRSCSSAGSRPERPHWSWTRRARS